MTYDELPKEIDKAYGLACIRIKQITSQIIKISDCLWN